MRLAIQAFTVWVVFQLLCPANGFAQWDYLDLGCYVFTQSHTCEDVISAEEDCPENCTGINELCTNPSYYYKYGEDYGIQWVAVQKSQYEEAGYWYDGNGFDIFCERYGNCECRFKPSDPTLSTLYCSETGNYNVPISVYPLDINDPCCDADP